MTMTSTILRVSVLSFALALPAAAQEDVDPAPVEAAVSALDAAFAAHDMQSVLGAMPPSVLTQMAEAYRLTEEDLRAEMLATMEISTAGYDYSDFGSDVSAAELGRTPAGRAYAVIPTVGQIPIPDGPTILTSLSTLAVEEGGVWYAMRMDGDRAYVMVGRAYPDLEGISIPLWEQDFAQ